MVRKIYIRAFFFSYFGYPAVFIAPSFIIAGYIKYINSFCAGLKALIDYCRDNLRLCIRGLLRSTVPCYIRFNNNNVAFFYEFFNASE